MSHLSITSEFDFADTLRPSICLVVSSGQCSIYLVVSVILVTHVAVNVKVMNRLLLPMRKSVAISIVLSLRVIT